MQPPEQPFSWSETRTKLVRNVKGWSRPDENKFSAVFHRNHRLNIFLVGGLGLESRQDSISLYTKAGTKDSFQMVPTGLYFMMPFRSLQAALTVVKSNGFSVFMIGVIVVGRKMKQFVVIRSQPCSMPCLSSSVYPRVLKSVHGMRTS